MIVNTAQGGGGSLPLNLFVQPDEPPIKDGLWIKAPESHTIKQITTKDSFVINGTWRDGGFQATLNNPAIQRTVKDNYIYSLTTNFTYGGGSSEYFIERFNLTTHTIEQVKLFQAGSDNNNKGFFIFKDSNTLYCEVVGYGQAMWTEAVELNLTDFSTVTVLAHSLLVQKYSDNYYYVGEDDNFAYIIRIYNSYESGTNYYTPQLYRISKTTDTISMLHEYSDLKTTSNEVYGGLYYNGKFYFAPVNQSTLFIYDIALDQCTTVTMPVTNTISLPMYAVYQNCVYLANATDLICYNILTNTFTQIAISNPPVTLNISRMFGIADQKQLLCIIGSYAVVYFDLQTETLPENSLAILDGSKYNIKLISTTKMNFLRTMFNNAWWYDTDFREFPTYIGNGTSFLKIKN